MKGRLGVELPPGLVDLVEPDSMSEQGMGRVGNRLLRVRTVDRIDAYLKIGVGNSAGEIVDEAERLRWIGNRLPVPEVLSLDEMDGAVYLLITALEGQPAHECGAIPVSSLVEAYAASMRAVHAMPIDDNPFENVVERELEESEHRVRQKLIDEAAFAETVGASPAQALRWLLQRPLARDRVFTHGDFALPNVLISGTEVSGLVDWALAGVADAHRDFMCAELTLRRNVDEDAIALFYEAYGRSDVDPERVRYFWVLDQYSTYYRPQEDL